MPALSPETCFLLNIDEGICLGEELIVRAMFDKKANINNNPPYVSYNAFMPRIRDGIAETALSFVHQDKCKTDEDIKIIAKTHINPNRTVWYLVKLLVQKIADMRFENGNLISLIAERDNNPFELHTSVYPVSEDEVIQLSVATVLARIAEKPVTMEGSRSFD